MGTLLVLNNVYGVSLKGINYLEEEVLIPPESRFRVKSYKKNSTPNNFSPYGGVGMDEVVLEMENPEVYKTQFYKKTGIQAPSSSNSTTIIIIVILAVVLIAAGVTTWLCCRRRSKANQAGEPDHVL